LNLKVYQANDSCLSVQMSNTFPMNEPRPDCSNARKPSHSFLS